MKKAGKEIKIENEKFKIKKFTLDANTTNSITLDLNSWLIPKYEIEDSKLLRNLQFKIKLFLFENINYQIFKKGYIVDLDIRMRNINTNKKTFYSLNITLFPINQNWKDMNFQSEIDNLIMKLQNFIINNQPFTFTSTK